MKPAITPPGRKQWGENGKMTCSMRSRAPENAQEWKHRGAALTVGDLGELVG
jgi:hypothetical protein